MKVRNLTKRISGGTSCLYFYLIISLFVKVRPRYLPRTRLGPTNLNKISNINRNISRRVISQGQTLRPIGSLPVEKKQRGIKFFIHFPNEMNDYNIEVSVGHSIYGSTREQF